MHKAVIYTDGACSHNPGGDGACAAILIHAKKPLCISGYIPAPTTNNRAEWAAVIAALSKLTAPCEVVVQNRVSVQSLLLLSILMSEDNSTISKSGGASSQLCRQHTITSHPAQTCP